MSDTKLTVFINKENSGQLFKENDSYHFNYEADAKDIVSLTMPHQSSSWSSKKIHL